VHVWGKPELDRAQQVLRLTRSNSMWNPKRVRAFGRGRARRVPYVKDALAENARIDLKPFAANARKSIEAAIADFRKSARACRSTQR